ncbi:MAG: DUF5054 domain-containing protein [Lentisphaeria bacterium]|jgi:hypothetical protein
MKKIAAPAVKTVHVVFKTHLDIGFTDFANIVQQQYLTRFIPQAIDRAAELRQAGGPERYVWTVGSWLVNKCLERSDPIQRRKLELAIEAGDVAWHALPFTTHTELLDESLFRFALTISQNLDRRFGRATIAAKLTDVPGHTLGMVPHLAAAGVRFLHIGVNPASTVPAVPPLFLWKCGKAEVVVACHGSYGEVVQAPGLPEALAIELTNDNLGPHSAEEVRAIFAKYRARFPNAEVRAARMDDFAAKLWQLRGRLPVVTDEIGDTWIHGAGSDPKKLAQYRALLRLRREFEAQGMDPQSLELGGMSRALLLVPEHTWGLDVKTHLQDFSRYTAEQLRELRQTPAARKLEASWQEQRGLVMQAAGQLRTPQLAAAGMKAIHEHQAVAEPARSGFVPITDPTALLDTPNFAVGLDPRTGAITRLVAKEDNRLWASSRQPLALYRYQTFGQQDYDRFAKQYLRDLDKNAAWALADFTKPGIAQAGALSQFWLPRLAAAARKDDPSGVTLLLDLAMPEAAVQSFGAPATLTLTLHFPANAAEIHGDLRWFRKAACRLPEASWLTFAPRTRTAGKWRFTKLGTLIDPLKVVADGARHLHAIDGTIDYRDAAGGLRLETPDAPLVAPGAPALLNFTNRRPNLAGGIHLNLHNNIWGTNFPMWYEDDARFRFQLAVTAKPPATAPPR